MDVAHVEVDDPMSRAYAATAPGSSPAIHHPPCPAGSKVLGSTHDQYMESPGT